MSPVEKTTRPKVLRRWLGRTAAAACSMVCLGAMSMGAAATAAVGAQAAGAVDPCLRVNEIYAVGGTATSTYNRDFVELRNVCGTAQNYQFPGSPLTLVVGDCCTAAANVSLSLSNITIPANGYYLVGFGAAAGTGAPFTADFNYGGGGDPHLLSANAIAGLTNTGIQFNICQPVDNGVWYDLVGYGTSPPCSETAPAPAPSDTQSISRDSPSTDSDNNNADFTLQAPSPRSSSSPTAVRVRSLAAVRTGSAVVLRWRTVAETDLLGFDVFREALGQRVKLNRFLIKTVHHNHVRGQAYSFRDPSRTSGNYWVRAHSLRGTYTWHGPVRAAPGR